LSPCRHSARADRRALAPATADHTTGLGHNTTCAAAPTPRVASTRACMGGWAGEGGAEQWQLSLDSPTAGSVTAVPPVPRPVARLTALHCSRRVHRGSARGPVAHRGAPIPSMLRAPLRGRSRPRGAPHLTAVAAELADRALLRSRGEPASVAHAACAPITSVGTSVPRFDRSLGLWRRRAARGSQAAQSQACVRGMCRRWKCGDGRS
jgi:hypothetical protein